MSGQQEGNNPQNSPATEDGVQAEAAEVVEEVVVEQAISDETEQVAVEVEPEVEVLEEANAEIDQAAKDLEALLKQAETKVEEQHDQIVRAHAEIENLKRRHGQELEKARKYGLDKFVSELLMVWDSLELGNVAAQDDNADVAKLREGTELTLKMLVDVMQKFGVEQHDPTGEPFNPELHQAMSMQPSEDVEPNHVIAVLQKGYSLNGRLVRPAMVMVSQAASS